MSAEAETREIWPDGILDYQFSSVRDGLIDLGWTDGALSRLPASARRHLGALIAGGVTPQLWEQWTRWPHKATITVLLAALGAGCSAEDAFGWATGHGWADRRTASAVFAGEVGLTYALYRRLNLHWSFHRVERSRLPALHEWYRTHLAAQIPVEVSLTWHPSTPIWVLRWAATGQVGDIPEGDQTALPEPALWLAVDILATYPDLPMEILAWVSVRPGGLERAQQHAARFAGVSSAVDWVRVQALEPPSKRTSV